MTASQPRTAGRLAAVLIRDLVFVIALTFYGLNAIAAHNTLAAGVIGFIWFMWVVITWGDLHRWTGPKQ